MRTRGVLTRTTLLLCRVRMAITSRGPDGPHHMLAEEALLAAFEGAPRTPQWLASERTEPLLEAAPSANVSPQAARNFIQEVHDTQTLWRPHIDSLADRQADQLAEAHSRVRQGPSPEPGSRHPRTHPRQRRSPYRSSASHRHTRHLHLPARPMSDSNIAAAGGLLSHDLLQRIAKADPTLAGLKPVDYKLAPDERVRDQTARSWSRLVGCWTTFRQAETRHVKTDPTATTLTRQRWLRPLLQELGFAGVHPIYNQAIAGKDYPISHQWGNHVPIHLLGWRIPIDRRTPGIPGAAKTSPHSLVQEFLNRSDQHLWGIVTNGQTLRILRDNASLTRVAYYEADLEAIFDGNRYSDFVALWRTCHRSRFDAPTPEQCILEQWNHEATTRGIRALDQLREGVKTALEQLGQGFLTHRNNRATAATHPQRASPRRPVPTPTVTPRLPDAVPPSSRIP